MKHGFAIALLSAVTLASSCSREDCTQYVNPLIGSGGHGHVFVGASVPFGMVQLGPTSVPQSWDWCSGYHRSDSTVIGFSHTHLEGTGIGDLFDVTILPVMGVSEWKRSVSEGTLTRQTQADVALRSSSEVAKPGYYSVRLKNSGATAELTATCHAGLSRFEFDGSDNALLLDLVNGGCWDKVTDHQARLEGNAIVGYRRSSGWAKDQTVHFRMEFSKTVAGLTQNGGYTLVEFEPSDAPLLVKVGISPNSVEAASKSLAMELPGWDFEKAVRKASALWNGELGRIRARTSDEKVRRVFYTALYHAMIVPAEFSDAGAKEKDYTILSLWDTYRAEMPLLSIVQPQRSAEMAASMVRICDAQGRLPVWHLWGNETDCMVGDPGVIAVADAIVKDNVGCDRKKAFEALLKTCSQDGRGRDLRRRHGYIPSESMHECIAFDMEYAIADAAVANAARAMAVLESDPSYLQTASLFDSLSHSWTNYFDPTTGFVRGRMADGSWRTPFSPFSSNHRSDDYCEGTAWQYTWLVPHDLPLLEKCFGSHGAMMEKLDELFTLETPLEGELISADISGLVGQYAHGNEPGHHSIYLYAMAGHPDKTARLVRKVLTELYSDNPDGLSGNEDAGQMSAWYVLSALGFYQTEPAGARYWFGSPLLDGATVTVPGGKFEIEVHDGSAVNCCIDRVMLNGRPYDLPYISHSDIMAGGKLEFFMRAPRG